MDTDLLQGLDIAGAGVAFALTTVSLLLLQPVAAKLNLLEAPAADG